jgi:hypothetical protein
VKKIRRGTTFFLVGYIGYIKNVILKLKGVKSMCFLGFSKAKFVQMLRKLLKFHTWFN